jgi:hypothetical protein
VPDPDLMLGDCRLPRIVPVDLVGIDDKLDASGGQQLVDNLKRVLCGERVGRSDEGDLVGESQALMAPAILLGPFNVLRGQSRQSDYLLAREGYRTGSAKGPNLGRLFAK